MEEEDESFGSAPPQDEDLPRTVGGDITTSDISSLGSSRRDDGSKGSSKLSTGTALLEKLEFEDISGGEGGPWWIPFLKKEGLFDKDTSTILPKEDEEQTGPKQDASVVSSPQSPSEEATTKAKVEDDDSSDKALQDETEDEWKERLWLVSRNNWNNDEDDPLIEVKTVTEAAEEAMLSSNLTQDVDHEQISSFQKNLLLCAMAYVQVFDDQAPPAVKDGATDAADNDDSKSTTTKKSNSTSSSSSRKRKNLNEEASQMSPYVPLNIVRSLFQQVLWDKIQKEQQDGRKKPHFSGMDDTHFHNFVEHVTGVLLSPELNIFRTYVVEPQEVDKDEDGIAMGALMKDEGRRVRTERIHDNRKRQRDIEQLLYGDLPGGSEEKKEDLEHAVDEEEVEEVGPQEEVRMREGCANMVRQLTKELESEAEDWRLPFVQEVLLKAMLKDSLSQDHLAVSHFLSSRVDRRSETSLAYMYAIRYFPHFFLRASWHQTAGQKAEPAFFRPLMQYFGDTKLIRNRLVVLGIYNGVLVHIQELNALMEDIKPPDGGDEQWDGFFRDVHRGIARCLGSVLEENMRLAAFLPSKTSEGVDWKATNITDNPSFQSASEHPKVVSVCLETGRSLHFQGVSLGKREQERLAKQKAKGVSDTEFNPEITELEVSSYLEAQSAFHGALKVLRRAEADIRESQQTHVVIPDEGREGDKDGGTPVRLEVDQEQRQAMRHITEAKVTIELYLADTLTTLAYCYEAKLSDFPPALKNYSDALTLYTRHVGKEHPTVTHTLQSIGCIHMELENWADALRCLKDCLDSVVSTNNDSEKALTLKNLGCVKLALADHDGAMESLTKAIDEKTSVLANSGRLVQVVNGYPGSPPADTFICDVLAKIVDVFFAKLSSLNGQYGRRRLALLYTENTSVDIEAIDAPRLARLQVERRVFEVSRDAIRMREQLLLGPDHLTFEGTKQKLSTEALNQTVLLDFVSDLTKHGKILFRRCDYSDAISCWDRAASLLDRSSASQQEDMSVVSGFTRAASKAFGEKRVARLSEVFYLKGIALCRLGENENAVECFDNAISYLEERRKLGRQEGSTVTKKRDPEVAWDVLDMDVAYCEHALGLAYFYSNHLTQATSHYREALRLFEAVAARRKARKELPDHTLGYHRPRNAGDREAQEAKKPNKAELDIAINNAIASVMLSLGSLYHEQDKKERSRRFLEGAIQIVSSATKRILTMPRGTSLALDSATGVNAFSLVVSIVRVGDAHRRLGEMNLEKRDLQSGRQALETGMRYLESTNLEARLTLAIDDEKHLESIGQNEINDTLIKCYEHILPFLGDDMDEDAAGHKWWSFGQREQGQSGAAKPMGLSREDLLFRLGNVHAKRKQYDSAIRCFLEARELTEDKLGTSEHPIIGNILFNLGNVYKAIYAAQPSDAGQKAKERAIEAFIDSLRITKVTTGPDSQAVAEVMEELAAVLMADGESQPEMTANDFEDGGATNFLRDAVSIRRKHRSEMSLAFSHSMHHFGVLSLRRFIHGSIPSVERIEAVEEAISSLSQALRVRRLLLGDHLDVAKTAHRLGLALWKKAMLPPGQMAGINAALNQMNDALFIRTLFLERSNSPEDGEASQNYGRRQHEWRAELDGAQDFSCVVMDSVENMYDIALLHQSQKNYPACQQVLDDTLKLMKAWRDPSSEGMGLSRSTRFGTPERNEWQAKIYHTMGVCWLECKDYDKAISEFEESLRYRGLDATETATHDEVFDNFFRQKPKRNSVRPGTLESAFTMECLAKCYEERKMFEEAQRCYAFCLRIFCDCYGPQDLRVANSLRQIGRVYQERHDYKRCVRALQRTLHIRDSEEDAVYVPRVDDALVYLQLARALMALGAYDEVALEHYHSAVGVLEDCNQVKQSKVTKSILAVSKNNAAAETPEDNNINNLLLEGYSSILVLLRRHGTDSEDDEHKISEVLHHIGNTQAALGQYEKALKSLTHVLQFQRRSKGEDHLSVSDILFNLGNIYVETGQVSRARDCHHECHVIASKILGTDSIDLAENMICLGNIEFLDTNFSLALEWFDEAMRLLRSNPEYEVAITKCLHRKAVAHDKLGEYEKAIECFGEVLKLGRKIWGTSHVELSNVLNSLGNVHRNRGELKRALRCYEESLRIRSKLDDRLGVANTKNNVGAIFTAMGNTDRARCFYAESLRIKTEKLGPDNIDTARTLYNLGQLYIVDKLNEKGLRFFCEALRIFKLEFGESHNEVASCLCSIGTIYDEMGNEELALSFFRRTLKAVKGRIGAAAVRASALHNVGIILTKRNDLDHAVRVFREALELKASESGSDDLSDTQYCLANVLRLTGCSSEAVELHRVSLDTRLRYLGPDHVDVASSMFGLSQSLVDTSAHRDALSLLNECLRIREDAFGHDDDLTADAMFLLGIVQREIGNLDESLGYLKHALLVKAESCGETSTEVADISFKIAIVLCEVGRYEEAKNYNKKCFDIRSSQGDCQSVELVSTLENMAIIEQKLGGHEKAIATLREVLSMKRSAAGDTHHDVANIVNAMAISFSELEQFDNALRLFEDSVKRRKLAHGPKHIDVARTLVEQGYAFERLDQYERALMCYEEAVDSDCFDDQSWEIGRVFMRMGISHFALSKPEDSWDCLSEATRIFELVERKAKQRGKSISRLETRTNRDLHELIRCYECMLRLSESSPARYSVDRSLVLPKVANVLAEIKDYERAAALYKDAIVLQKSLPGDTRFVVAMNMHNLGNCLYELGDYNEALTCLEDALGLLQDIPGVEGKHVADTYHSLAVVHQARTDLQESLTCYSNALKSRRTERTLDRSGVLSTLTNMGDVLRSLGMYDASIKCCKDALRLVEAKGEEKQLIVSQIVECIGMTHKDRQENEKALRCFLECLKQRKEATSSSDPIIGKTQYELGLIHLRKDEKAKAQAYFGEAVETLTGYLGIQESGIENLKFQLQSFVAEHDRKAPIEAAGVLSTFSSLMHQCERFNDAVVCDALLVEFVKSKVRSDHLLIAAVSHRMGTAFFNRENFSGAIPPLRESLRVRRARLGPNHVDTQDTLRTLARAYAASGDSEMALYCFKEVMQTEQSKSTKTDVEGEADLLLRLSKLHLEQKEYSEALACIKDSLRLQRQRGKSRNEQKLGESLQCMGSALLSIEQFHEARLTLLSALKMLERVDESGKEVMVTAFLLGRVNEDEACFEKALAWYDRSLAILKRAPKADLHMKGKIVYRVGTVKYGMKQYNEALCLIREAKELFGNEVGVEHEDFASCVHSCGLVHLELENFEDARDSFRSALQTRRKRLKRDDPDVGDSLHYLGLSLLELDQPDEARVCLKEALRVRLHKFGDDHAVLGETQRCLGRAELELGQQRASMECFHEAIRIGMNELKANGELKEVAFNDLLGCFDSVISMARNGKSPDRLGRLYHQQGTLYTSKRMYKEALASFTEAIQVYKAAHGEGHLDVANALFNVGVCLKETGDVDRAMKCFSRALSITRSHLGEDHQQVAETLQEMAEVYRMKNDLKGAIKWCEKAINIRRYTEDLALAALLNFAGELYTSCDDSGEAERSFRECVRIRRKVYGDDHLEVAEALFSLGYVYEVSRMDYKRALRSYEEALRIRKNLMEEADLEAARCYLHLGSVHAAVSDDKKATYCFNVAISLCAELGQAENEIVEDAIVGQGHALLGQGKPEAALAQYERAITMRKDRCVEGQKDESKEAADLRVFEANALEKLEKPQDAMNRLVLALDMYKSSVGMEHLSTAVALQRIAEVNIQLGHEDEALSSAQLALKIRKNRLGNHDVATGDSYFVIGKIMAARDEFEKAKPCLAAACEIFRHKRAADHESVSEAMFLLGCIYESSRDWDEALRCFQGALPGRQKNSGSDQLPVAETLFKLGSVHKRRDENETSADYFSECLRIRTAAYGPDHVTIADTLYELACAMTESDKVSGKIDPPQCYVDAIRIYRQSLGESHVAVAKCLARLGDIMENRDDLQKAGNCYEKAVAIFESKLSDNPSPEEIDTLRLEDDYEAYAAAVLDYASFLDGAGNDGSAMKTYRRALVLYRALRGGDDEVIDETLCKIANVLGRQERFGEALQLLEEVRKRREASGNEEPFVGDVYFALANLHEKQREYPRAIAALEVCLRIRRGTTGAFSEDVGAVLKSIGRMQAQRADFIAAIRSWEEALAIYKKAGVPNDSEDVKQIYDMLGNAEHMLETMDGGGLSQAAAPSALPTNM